MKKVLLYALIWFIAVQTQPVQAVEAIGNPPSSSDAVRQSLLAKSTASIKDPTDRMVARDEDAQRIALAQQTGKRGAFYEISDLTRFRRLLKEELFLMVLFYASNQSGNTGRVTALRTQFKSLARGPTYRGRGIVFAEVDTRIPSFNTYVQNLGINQIPSIVIFKRPEGELDAQALTDEAGTVMSLGGFSSRDDIVMFIESNIGSDLENSRRR